MRDLQNTCLTLALCLVLFPFSSQADNGLRTQASPYSVSETADRLTQVLEKRGMTVFNRIDHGSAAQGAGIKLRDTELVIFGNPKVGSKLMQCGQTIAIDLPQKILVWQDDEGKVWLGWNNQDYLGKRHKFRRCAKLLGKVGEVIRKIVVETVQP